jgi:hypothetical protein
MRMIYNGERRWKAAAKTSELIREAFAGRGVKLSGSSNLLEVKTMLATQFEAWREQWFAEGFAEGFVKGWAEALMQLLEGRFGVVAPSWQKRIHAARLVTLKRWFKRAIVAPDLPSVFNPPR